MDFEKSVDRIHEYLKRVCLCGQPRSEHAHFHSASRGEGGVLRLGRDFVVRSVTNPECQGFVDSIELELQGNPLENPLLGPLVQAQLDRPSPTDPEAS